MSFEALKWSFDVSQGHAMGSADRLVLWYLSHMHNDEQRKAWPSQQRICDMTGLSKAGVNRALNNLIESGLIRRKVGLGRRNTQYFLGLDFTPSAHNCTTSSQGENTTGPVVSPANTTLLTTTYPINSESKEAHASGDAPITAPEKPMKLPKGMSVSAITAAAKSEYSEVPDDKILAVPRIKGKFTVGGLSKCWTLAHGKYVAGYQPTLRLKDQGQLKQAYAKVGDTLPHLILTVLQNWTAFAALVKQNTSSFNPPAKPEIGFFVRHVAVAADFVLKQEAPASGAVKSVGEHLAKAKSKPAAPVQSIAAAPPVGTPLTVADIEAAFDGAAD